MKTRKILITGANGYLGSAINRRLFAANCDLILLDKKFDLNSLSPSGDSNISIKRLVGDIRDYHFMKACFDEQGIDTVIHLAAISDGKSGRADPKLTRTTNYECFENLVRLSQDAGVRRFILASTFGVYGNSYTEKLHEALPLDPKDVYSETKALCEEKLRTFNSANFTTVSIRIAMVYGLSLNIRTDFLVNNLALQATTNGAIAIQGGAQRRPQIHIQDIANYFFDLAVAEPRLVSGQIFNAVGQNPSVLEVANIIGNYFKNLEVKILKSRDDENSFEMSGAKIERVLGLKPNYTLHRGVLELLKFYYEMGKKRLDLLPQW